MARLLRFETDQKKLIYDFETCNLNLVSTEFQAPWQLGWQVYQGKKHILSKEDWIWWDDLQSKMGKAAAELTGFDYDTYKRKAQPAQPILESFETYLLDKEVISVSANGVNFDQYIYQIYRRLLGKGYEWSWATRHVDIQTLHKAYILGMTPPPIGTKEWILFNIKMSQVVKKGLKTSLAFMCKEFGVDYDPTRHHREALYDVELTDQIFEQQLYRMDIYIDL